MKTKDARSLPGDAQADLRKKAVHAVLHGAKQIEVAQRFGVTRQSVGKWVKAYREGGRKQLEAKRRGRPKGGSLLPWQAAQIAKTVIDRPPEQLKLPFVLWTREALSQWIEQGFGIRLSGWTVGRYLNRWGFTPQKPVRRALEKNPEAVRRWLEQEYPVIRARAKEAHATIYWGDETGLRSDHATGRTDGRRGQTPVILGTGQRFGCNMISAVTNRGQLHFMVFQQHFSAEVLIDFLQRLIRQSQRIVFLILDRHPVHRSRKVKAWLAAKDEYLRLFYLPGYSSELNPNERLNQDVKSNAVGRKRPHDQKELISHVRSFLWSRQRRPEIVQRFF